MTESTESGTASVEAITPATPDCSQGHVDGCSHRRHLAKTDDPNSLALRIATDATKGLRLVKRVAGFTLLGGFVISAALILAGQITYADNPLRMLYIPASFIFFLCSFTSTSIKVKLRLAQQDLHAAEQDLIARLGQEQAAQRVNEVFPELVKAAREERGTPTLLALLAGTELPDPPVSRRRAKKTADLAQAAVPAASASCAQGHLPGCSHRRQA